MRVLKVYSSLENVEGTVGSLDQILEHHFYEMDADEPLCHEVANMIYEILHNDHIEFVYIDYEKPVYSFTKNKYSNGTIFFMTSDNSHSDKDAKTLLKLVHKFKTHIFELRDGDNKLIYQWGNPAYDFMNKRGGR